MKQGKGALSVFIIFFFFFISVRFSLRRKKGCSPRQRRGDAARKSGEGGQERSRSRSRSLRSREARAQHASLCPFFSVFFGGFVFMLPPPSAPAKAPFPITEAHYCPRTRTFSVSLHCQQDEPARKKTSWDAATERNISRSRRDGEKKNVRCHSLFLISDTALPTRLTHRSEHSSPARRASSSVDRLE